MTATTADRLYNEWSPVTVHHSCCTLAAGAAVSVSVPWQHSSHHVEHTRFISDATCRDIVIKHKTPVHSLSSDVINRNVIIIIIIINYLTV